jgi:hypothetical protein
MELQLWIESDSKLINLAIKSFDVVPCKLKNRWLNSMAKIRGINFIISHIYRDGHHCADKFDSIDFFLNVPKFGGL